MAARLPIAGRRVPLRAYWRRRPLQLTAGVAPLRARAFATGVVAAAMTRDAMTAAASRTMAATRRRPIIALAAGMGLGLMTMYYADPLHGRRRRALMRDRLAHMRHVVMRDVPRTVERRGRFMRGVARGITHEAADLVHVNGRHELVDDETLVARVRSEALRERGIKAGEIHIDAYEGCVTLRGQLPHPDEIHHLIEAAKRVEGVREVRSYLHLPGTLPPNKAESYVHVPAEYART